MARENDASLIFSAQSSPRSVALGGTPDKTSRESRNQIIYRRRRFLVISPRISYTIPVGISRVTRTRLLASSSLPSSHRVCSFGSDGVSKWFRCARAEYRRPESVKKYRVAVKRNENRMSYRTASRFRRLFRNRVPTTFFIDGFFSEANTLHELNRVTVYYVCVCVCVCVMCTSAFSVMFTVSLL